MHEITQAKQILLNQLSLVVADAHTVQSRLERNDFTGACSLVFSMIDDLKDIGRDMSEIDNSEFLARRNP